MSRIFISYRRDDTAGHAGRLFDRLCARLGKDSVFMDVEGIEAGLDFVEAIEAAVGSCDVLLAVIGRAWLDIRDSQGRRRLDDPRDFIRLETATALARHIRVIPVLVEGAAMPTEELLPDILQPLARRQAVDLRDSRWAADIENLMQVLERVLAVPSARSPGAAAAVASGATSPAPVAAQPLTGDSRSSWRGWLAASAALLVLGVGIAYFIGAGGPGKIPAATPVVTSAAPTPPVEAKAPVRPVATPPAASAPAPSVAPATPAAPIADAQPSAPRPAPAVGPSAPAALAAAPMLREKSAPPKSGSSPAKTPRLAPAPSAESPTVASQAAQLARAPVQAPVLPVVALKIAIVTMGETTSRSFWGGERVAAYGAKMAALYDGALRQQAPGKIEVQARSDGALAKPILDGSSRATQQVCDSTGASVIFVAHAQQAFSLSQLDSPYFPELRLGAIACASGKRQVGSYNLAPRNDEAFPFAQDMGRAMTDFVREKLPQVQ